MGWEHSFSWCKQCDGYFQGEGCREGVAKTNGWSAKFLIGGPPLLSPGLCGIFPCSILDGGQKRDIIGGGVSREGGVGVTAAALKLIELWKQTELKGPQRGVFTLAGVRDHFRRRRSVEGDGEWVNCVWWTTETGYKDIYELEMPLGQGQECTFRHNSTWGWTVEWHDQGPTTMNCQHNKLSADMLNDVNA